MQNFTGPLAIGAVGVLPQRGVVVPLIATIGYTTNMRYGTIGESTPRATAGPGLRRLPVPRGTSSTRGLGAVPLGWVRAHRGRDRRRRRLPAAVDVRRAGHDRAVRLAFRFWTELGTHVWNLRLLSFWYFGVHLLIAIGVAELIRGAGWLAVRGAGGWPRSGGRSGPPRPPTPESDGYGGYDEYGRSSRRRPPGLRDRAAAPVVAASWVDRALAPADACATVAGARSPRSW